MKTKIRPYSKVKSFAQYLDSDDCVVILYNPDYLIGEMPRFVEWLWKKQLTKAHEILTKAKDNPYGIT